MKTSKLKVGGISLDVTSYDNDMSLLEKYSIKMEGTIPAFFRIVSRSDKEIKLEDIRKILDIPLEKLVDPRTIESISSHYPLLSKKEIGYLWVIDRGTEILKRPDSLWELQKIDRYAFITIKKVEEGIKALKKNVDLQRKKIEDTLNSEKSVFNKLEEVDGVGIEDFILEETTSSLSISLPQKQSIIEIFDSMNVSRDIPFIFIFYQGQTYYKIYQEIIPLPSWIEFTPHTEGIYFKVSNLKGTPSGKTLLDNVYSWGNWFPDGRVILNFISNSEELVTKRVFDSLGKRIEYEIVSEKQLSIKGTFKVTEFDFNKIVLADLIYNNPIYKYFTFANERDSTSSYRTLTTRKRFYFYYQPNHTYQINESLAITIIPTPERSATIRIIRGKNIQQILSVKNVLSKLFGVFQNEKDSVLEDYSALLPDIEGKSKRDIKEKKKNLKTRKRATDLAEYDPDMFRSRYPDQCQRESQPYVMITEDEAQKKIKELGNPHKVIKFGDVWYACEPREEDDKDQVHIWPGLKENSSKTDTKYISEHPLLPCCYTQDQYTKKASCWRRYSEEGNVTCSDDNKEKEFGVGHIVKGGKSVAFNRYGEIPFNWEKVLKYLKIEKINKGKQEIYPLLRRGVAQSPDSFIHCVEAAMKPELYSIIPSPEEAKKYIMKVRNDISEKIPLEIGAQELYDMYPEDIRSELLDESAYIAPEKYISILQYYYKCNIFMYVVDEDHPFGEILHPRSKDVYLSRYSDETLPTILIIKYESDDYPYQCEIMVEVEVRNNKFENITTKFINHPISRCAMDIYHDSNDVFIIGYDGYSIYKPSWTGTGK